MESTKYLLIGGGIASVAAAQSIRKRDTEGRLILVTADSHMPYDRPPLSKNFLTNPAMTPDDPASKFDNFYPDNSIELWRSARFTSIRVRDKVAVCEDGREIQFEKLLLATGSRARKLPGLEGNPSVHYLRTMDDALKLRDAMQSAQNAIVIGTGFLGPEIAASMAVCGIATTVVSLDEYPWQSFASKQLGKFVLDYFEANNVRMLMNNSISALEDSGVAIASNKVTIPTDLTVAAVGADLNLELAKDAGIDLIQQEGVLVDEFLQSSNPDIYAAGDIARFKDLALDQIHHLEHHLNARWQGEVAGANMAGERAPYDRVPYFFSDLFDEHMVLRGDITAPKQYTTVMGSFEDGEFIELYADEADNLKMAVAFSRDEKKLDGISDKLEEMLRAKKKVGEVSMLDF